LTALATRIDTRFGKLGDQFNQYKTELGSYKDYMVKLNENRLDARISRDAESNDHARQ